MMKQILMTVCVCLVTTLACATDYTMTTGDAAGTNSFILGTHWTNGLPPSAGNRYFTGINMLRTPENTTGTAYTFMGDRLTINGGSMLWKSSGNITISDLVLDGGSIAHGLDNYTGRLFGTVTVSRASSFTANEGNPRIFMIYSTVTGTGNVTVAMNQTNSLKQTSFLADNSGFTGRIILNGLGKFGVCSEEGLGGNPAFFMANQLEFNGSTLVLTNSLTLDDANRGIALNNTSNPGSFIYPGGVFEVANSATATVACAISGAGTLTKRGNGTLALATNDTYTGQTTVEAGTLRMVAGASQGTPSMVVSGVTSMVSGEGTLSNVTLLAGGRLGAEKGGWSMKSLSVQNTTNVTFALDLSQAATNVTLIRVGGTLTKQPMQVFQFTVNTNNAVAAPYQVLSASNLADFAEYDFCVTPPWIGELSRTNDAGGGQLLLFTPTLPEKIVFQVANDPINTTAFLEGAKWSDGLAPTNPPTGVKTYVSQGFDMRTPYDRSATFGGKRLIVNGQNIGLKGALTIPTITDLTMMNEAWFSTAEPIRDNMAGNIRLRPVFDAGKTYAMKVTGGDSGRNLYLFSTLSGYGDLFLQNTGDPSYSNNIFTLFSPSTNFFGKIQVDGHTNLWLRIAAEEMIGGNPPFFRADQLRFNGGGISVTNNVTLDDANRGITLLATGGTSATDANVGGFSTNATAAQLAYPGGAMLRAEGTNTLTILCPITGAGSLTKNGAGRLVLGGANSYTGLTQIIAGTLEPVSTNAFGIGPVLLKPEGRLLRRYPGATLASGVALGSTITFESGSQVVIQLDAGYSVSHNFTVPLFTAPSSVAIDPASVPVQYSLSNYKAMVVTADAGNSRTLFSAKLTFQGALMLVK